MLSMNDDVMYVVCGVRPEARRCPGRATACPSVTTKNERPDAADQDAVDARADQRRDRDRREHGERRGQPDVVEELREDDARSARAASRPRGRCRPVSTTNVIPIETTQRIETLVSRFSMFCCVKKLSWVTEKKTKRPIEQREHDRVAVRRRPHAGGVVEHALAAAVVRLMLMVEFTDALRRSVRCAPRSPPRARATRRPARGT